MSQTLWNASKNVIIVPDAIQFRSYYNGSILCGSGLNLLRGNLRSELHVVSMDTG